MMAIVYSQPLEGQEYIEYIDFLKNKQLLKGPVQQFELEELQGVSGLKGLRVAINLEEEPVKETNSPSTSVDELGADKPKASILNHNS
jgi:hypothetical protein